MQEDQRKILLFDGVCNLCAGAVQFVLKRNKTKDILFASLQSEAGQALLKIYNLDANQLTSLVFIDGGKAYMHSSGALRLAKYLRGLWPILYIFMIVPKFIRDGVYNWVAKNRYRWFGQKEACWLPTPELKQRFLS